MAKGKSRRFAFVDRKRCVSCGACRKVCPKDAIAIWKGLFSLVDSDLCIGCGKCVKECPAGCIALQERGAENDG